MPTLRAVFFDFDDTLCDAQTAFDRALQVAFDAIRSRHPHLSEAQLSDGWRTVHTPLFADLAAGRLTMSQVRLLRFRNLLTTLGKPDDAFADQVDLLLGHVQLDLLKLFDGVPAILAELRRRGLYVGIITNGAGDSHPDSQRSKAEHLRLLEQVDSFWASDDIGHRKPDPRAFLPGLLAVGCEPHEALYVGDSRENDIVGANRVGMISVLMAREEKAVPEISADAPDKQPRHRISSVAEVLGLVHRIRKVTD